MSGFWPWRKTLLHIRSWSNTGLNAFKEIVKLWSSVPLWTQMLYPIWSCKTMKCYQSGIILNYSSYLNSHSHTSIEVTRMSTAMTRGDQNKFRWQYKCLEQIIKKDFLYTVWWFSHDWKKEKTIIILKLTPGGRHI